MQQGCPCFENHEAWGSRCRKNARENPCLGQGPKSKSPPSREEREKGGGTRRNRMHWKGRASLRVGRRVRTAFLQCSTVFSVGKISTLFVTSWLSFQIPVE
jgi:hypothetical protein